MASLKTSQAWKHFAAYIKKRDRYTCFTCDRKAEGSGLHAGHFVQAFGHQNTFFNEKNVAAQCYNCNINKYGNIWEYGQRLNKKYGEGTTEELTKLGKVYKQWAKKELKELAKKYKELTKSLHLL